MTKIKSRVRKVGVKIGREKMKLREVIVKGRK
jgi:hypothetical protein